MPSRFFTPSIGTLAICLLAAATSAVVGAQRTGQSGEADILAGTIDIHVHADPDSAPRVMDGLEIAALARSKGMRGIVLKNHYESTAGLAYLARKAAPGLEVFGGIDLNLTVGGLNVFAIEQMTGVVGGWGRIVCVTRKKHGLTSPSREMAPCCRRRKRSSPQLRSTSSRSRRDISLLRRDCWYWLRRGARAFFGLS
jgi:uncharacterized protein DUF6282